MWDLDSPFAAFSRAVIQVAQLNEKLIVGLPELQAVQAIARLRRQLNRRQIRRCISFCTLLNVSISISGSCFPRLMPPFRRARPQYTGLLRIFAIVWLAQARPVFVRYPSRLSSWQILAMPLPSRYRRKINETTRASSFLTWRTPST